MGRVQFGLIVPDIGLDGARRHRYLEQVHQLLHLVTGHFTSAWLIDHLEGEMLEGWTALCYLAALHPELHWGHTVLCQSFRNPALLAKMGATIQLMAGGRFILGIGAGGQEGEYRAYGYDFPPGQTRVAELDETLQIIKAMWTQERATFEGQHYRIQNATCEPKPDQLPPIVVGAFRPQMLRLTARHADWWNVSSTDIEGYRQYLYAFQQACAVEGRDPASVQLVWSGGCVCAASEAQVAALAAERGELMGDACAYRVGESFVGTPAQIVAQMQPFIELGVDYFLLDCGGFPQLTTAELLVNEVLPALNR